jgi:hypothetical protein
VLASGGCTAALSRRSSFTCSSAGSCNVRLGLASSVTNLRSGPSSSTSCVRPGIACAGAGDVFYNPRLGVSRTGFSTCIFTSRCRPLLARYWHHGLRRYGWLDTARFCFGIFGCLLAGTPLGSGLGVSA